MVSTQAQTMRIATPQRTAESFEVAPTPMIEPVMVWVVETGMPSSEEAMIEVARGGLGREAVDRLQLGHLHAQRADHPPAAGEGAEADGEVAASTMTQTGTWNSVPR